MFGKKKTTGTATPVPQVSNKKKIEDCLTSMSFLSHFVIDKKESLVEEEIKTVREIDKVKTLTPMSLNTMPRSAKLLIPFKKNSEKSEKFPANLRM